MGGGDNYGHPIGDTRQDQVHQGITLIVGEQELFGPVGQDANAVSAGIDQEIDAAELPFGIQRTRLGKDGRGDGKHSVIGLTGQPSLHSHSWAPAGRIKSASRWIPRAPNTA